MKSILLHIQNNDGLEARFQSALDITRAVQGHLSCIQIIPLYTYDASDNFAGPLGLDAGLNALDRQAKELKGLMKSRLAEEDVAWDYQITKNRISDGLASASLLADLVVIGSIREADRERAGMGLIGDLMMSIETPILLLPDGAKSFKIGGTAMIAWNGSIESAHALRAAVPLLTLAEKIVIVNIEGKKSKKSLDEFPSTAASEYLSRHGISSELLVEPAVKADVADTLTICAKTLNADYIVMGAYGHSRVREYLLGGVTRAMLKGSKIPVLFAR